MIIENYSQLQETIQQPTSVISIQSYAFLFVNFRSGSRLGDDLIKSHIKQIKVNPTPDLNTTFSIYDLSQQKQRTIAFKNIFQKSKIADKLYIIICGGDGTVSWVIEESLKAQIDFQNVIFSILPIGTGNDFAKSIGWGNFHFDINHENFQKLALELDNAHVGSYDMWKASIECYNSGFIIQIKNGRQSQREEKSLVKNFTNYCGIGTDAQIAYIAQRLKARTAGLKRVAYGLAGFLSFWMFCGSLRRIITQIESTKEQQLNQIQQLQISQNDIKPNKPNKPKHLNMQNIKISKYDCCMTFINSTSSMDLKGIWKTPYKASSQIKEKVFKEQQVNDGLIEIVSYRNQISLWFERFLHMAKKVGQGNGPYIINFRQPKQNKSHQIYIQINGQPYRVTNVKSIKVSQSSQFPNSKIKVLYRKK